MQKKQCPNGHIYDPSIYGDQCPLCPPSAGAGTAASAGSPATHVGSSSAAQPDLHTHVAGGFNPSHGATTVATPGMSQGASSIGASVADPAGSTRFRPQEAEPKIGGHTVIRHASRPGAPTSSVPSRKLVGFLVSYNRDANGKAYQIYEGRNFVGRDPSCDISVPDDEQMSGRHLSILYRNVDDKFKFRDEQSSNGTFINKELMDDGELQNYDIIRAGSTIFIFIAIPKIS